MAPDNSFNAVLYKPHVFGGIIRKRIKIDSFSIYDRNLRAFYSKALLLDDLAFCLNITDTELPWLHGKCSDKSIPVSGGTRMG